MELTKEEIKDTATKNFNELIESCENLTINQKRVAFKRIIQDEVEPGEVGVLVRQKLSEHLEFLNASADLTPEQLIVLEHLKSCYKQSSNAPILTFATFAWEHFCASHAKEVKEAYEYLTNAEEFEMIQEFIWWGMENRNGV